MRQYLFFLLFLLFLFTGCGTDYELPTPEDYTDYTPPPIQNTRTRLSHTPLPSQNTQIPYKFPFPLTSEHRESLLIKRLSIKEKIEEYTVAINAFYTEEDKSTNHREVIETAIGALLNLERSIEEFKRNSGNSTLFSKIERTIYADKNILLFAKYEIPNKVLEYTTAMEDFSLLEDAETAWTALKKNMELKDSVSKFKESGGDQELSSEIENKLDDMKVILEMYVYETV